MGSHMWEPAKKKVWGLAGRQIAVYSPRPRPGIQERTCWEPRRKMAGSSEAWRGPEDKSQALHRHLTKAGASAMPKEGAGGLQQTY